MTVDDRIAVLAKRIDEENPPPVLMRRWIREVLSEMLDEKQRYIGGVNISFDAPIIPGGRREHHLRDCRETLEYYQETHMKVWELVRDNEDCDACEQVRRLTMPTPIG